MKFCLAAILLAFAGLQGCEARYASNNLEQNSNGANNLVSTENTRAGNVAAPPKPTETPLHFDSTEGRDAAAVIQDYYAAVNSRNFRKAYEFWSGNGEASKQTFKQFRAGFAKTAAVEINLGEPSRMEAAMGSRYITIPLTIKATTTDGKEQNFAGEYVLRRSVADGATTKQRLWRIYSAEIKRK